MASKSILSLLLLLLLLLLCFLLKQNIASDCRSIAGHGCFSAKPAVFQAFQSRKVLRAMREMKVGGVDGGRRPAASDQLRRVPSGPDPLHHNGGSPKKPRTP